ncbi:MAG: hypothetical protein Q9209_006693 [Squamulea sp. 1 TL-2023]
MHAWADSVMIRISPCEGSRANVRAYKQYEGTDQLLEPTLTQPQDAVIQQTPQEEGVFTMDPISVAASLLTVIGAAATAGRTLDFISSSKHAPEHLVALVNEVSNLRVVLYNVRDAVQERAKTSQECGNLGFIVQRATLKLSELNRLIYGNLLKTNTGNNSINDDDIIKASRRAFLRHSGKIKSLKEEIQDIKMSMMIAMGAMTFSDVSRLKLDVCDVSLVAAQQQASQPLEDPSSFRAGSRSRELQMSTPDLGLRNEGPQSLTNRLPNDPSYHRPPRVFSTSDNQQLSRRSIDNEALQQISMPFRDQFAQPINVNQKYSHIRIEASVSSASYQRDRLCLCRCHQVTTMASPGDWSRLLGRLFVGYTGLPVLSNRCDRKSCQHGQVQARVRVAYLFPFWFALRLFALTITKASTSFMWKLDFPAVTSGSSDMFVQASLGNIENIQGMLSMDAGAFNVIDSVANKSPLHIALQFRQIASVSLLVDQGADMYVQDCNNKTPLDTFYENYFITSGEKRMEALLPLFEKYDVFDHWNLRQIHLIILGWSSVDLTTYLSISIDEADVYDSWGRTPLMWAAWRGDSESVSILLDHGADPQATSFDGNSVLIYATYGGDLECMNLILNTGADINHMSNSILTPAMGGSQLGDNPAIAKVRLMRGAAIEASRHQKFTPLYVAALTNKVESLAFLLDCGASTEWSDWNCSDPLSLAISFSNHRMAEALIIHGANLNIAPAFTVSYLRNVAVFGDEKMLRLFINAKPAINVDLKDPQGFTASDRMKERLSSMGPSDLRKDVLAAAFQELVDVCADEFERAQKPPEYVVIEEINEDEKGAKEVLFHADEEDVHETFHDALEDQDAPTVEGVQHTSEPLSPPPVYGVQTTDWALHRTPVAGASILTTEWGLKRSPTAEYQDSGQKRFSKSSGHWYSPPKLSRSGRSGIPAAIQEVI